MASLSSAALLLFTSAAGAGLLSYPFANMQQGVLLNVILTLLFAINNVFTDLILVQIAAMFRHTFTVATFDELCYRALGRRAYYMASTAVFAGNIGALIGFLIVLGDVLQPTVSHLCECSSWYAGRPFIMSAFALFVALPLSSVEKIHSLAITSFLAGFSVLAVGFIVVDRGSRGGFSGDIIGITFDAPDSSASAPLVLARLNFVGIALGVPISIFSLGNHCQIVPTFCELPKDLRKRFLTPVLAAVMTCWVLYTLTGSFGYAAFRNATKGDVLLNFPVGIDIVSDAAKGLLGIHVLLAYPILVWPARTSLATLLNALSVNKEGKTAKFINVLSKSSLYLSVIIVIVTTSIAIFIPQVVIVFGLIGASIATYEIFIVPALLLLKWSAMIKSNNDDDDENDKELLITRDIDEVKKSASEFQPFGDVWSDIDRDNVWRKAIEEIDSGKTDDIPLFLWKSKTVLKAQGYFLFAIGTLVIIAGTGTYIWSTFVVTS
jgi:amino acid permease